MEIGIDVISDLNLSPEDSFNWENKATSLYCIVAGNISKDVRTTIQILVHLSKFYQGVFYTMGSLDYETAHDYNARTKHLVETYNNISRVAVLHHHVVIIDGMAILGVNGWEKTPSNVLTNRLDDLSYLNKSINKLQRHLDVKKIVLVSNAVPNKDLYFGEIPKDSETDLELDYCLTSDTENKVSHWVFGSYNKNVDTVINGVNFVNNSYYKRKPYWPKRINVVF